MGREEVKKEIVSEILSKLNLRDKRFSLFSFGSTDPCSDIDLVLLLKHDELNPERFKYYDEAENYKRIKKTLDEIAEEHDDYDVTIFLAPLEYYFNLDVSSLLLTLTRSNEGWGNIAPYYRLFYVTMTGKTEAGKKIIEDLRFDPRVMNVPEYEGEELFTTCKRDAIEAIAMALTNGNKKVASNKMAKAILRTIEAFRIRIRCRPAYSDEGIYEKIFQEGKLLFLSGLYSDYEEVARKALDVKRGRDTYEFNYQEIMGFVKFFNYFKRLFVKEAQIGIKMPREHYTELINYSKDTARRVIESYKNMDKDKRDIFYSVALIVGEDLIEYAEEIEHAEGDLYNDLKDDLPILKDLLKKISNIGELSSELAKKMIEEDGFYYAFAGGVKLMVEDYEQAERLLQKAVSLQKELSIHSVVPSLYDSSLRGRLALAKFKNGKHEEARKLIDEAINKDSLNPFLWDVLCEIEGDGGYKELSKIIENSVDPIKAVLLEPKLKGKHVKRFFESWENYTNCILNEDYKYFSEVQGGLEERLNDFEERKLKNKEEINRYTLMRYLILYKQTDLITKLVKAIDILKESGDFITYVDYKKYLKLKLDIISYFNELEHSYDALAAYETSYLDDYVDVKSVSDKYAI
ncbi:MAG: hypothetical protein J7K22_01140 [Nanoarchaeota archaeon]|nr:hypothetical protein [Nanoarchaeota archaeon]